MVSICISRGLWKVFPSAGCFVGYAEFFEKTIGGGRRLPFACIRSGTGRFQRRDRSVGLFLRPDPGKEMFDGIDSFCGIPVRTPTRPSLPRDGRPQSEKEKGLFDDFLGNGKVVPTVPRSRPNPTKQTPGFHDLPNDHKVFRTGDKETKAARPFPIPDGRFPSRKGHRPGQRDLSVFEKYHRLDGIILKIGNPFPRGEDRPLVRKGHRPGRTDSQSGRRAVQTVERRQEHLEIDP